MSICSQFITYQLSLITNMKIQSILKWLVAFVVAVVIILVLRQWVIASYRISTDAMAETLHEGDFILVDKLPLKENPGRNRVVLFSSPVSWESYDNSLLISRCMGMPGDTISIQDDGLCINGILLPYPPHSLHLWWVDDFNKDNCLKALKTLEIPVREWEKRETGHTLLLTSFEAWQVREEIDGQEETLQRYERMAPFAFVVPRKGYAYRLDETAIQFCERAIMQETNGEARFRDGKLFLDGKETTFFFFNQDYYWLLSDNLREGVDSRHLGFIPADHIVGNAWLYLYSRDRQRIFNRIP